MSSRGRGRGAYFKAKYGNGSRGAGDHTNHPSSADAFEQYKLSTTSTAGSRRSWDNLKKDLQEIDGQQYGAYKRLLGRYVSTTPSFVLAIDHVQSDAYAAPSRVRVMIDWKSAGFPDECVQTDVRAVALVDYLTRAAASFIRSRHMNEAVANSAGGWSGPKGGVFDINAPGQEILPRTSALITGPSIAEKNIELRFTVSLPARGRTCLGQQAWTILGVNLVDLVKATLLYTSHQPHDLSTHINSAEDQEFMRSQLDDKDLIAFVADGSILPRASGASARPQTSTDVIPFRSPPDLTVTLSRKHGPAVSGMGIPSGVTLLTGGGFHGKSTLLEALQLGVYNHIPGDGRELVVSDPNAVKIRAEDGRSVAGTDISTFIREVPGGKNTAVFTTDNASGSTSMAANIQEALEIGCTTLLIDEDSSATNLLVRDERMQLLVRNEPITPLVSKVRALHADYGVSTIIVVGGLGDWLSVADQVIGMDSYVPRPLTQEAKTVTAQIPRRVFQEKEYGPLPQRSIHFPPTVLQERTPFAKSKGFITLPYTAGVKDPAEADAGIDVSSLDQLVEVGQTKFIAHAIRTMAQGSDERDLGSRVKELETWVSTTGRMPEQLHGGDFVAVRRFEVAAAISRLRGLTAKTVVTDSRPLSKRKRFGP